jgi:hypothetical protein
MYTYNFFQLLPISQESGPINPSLPPYLCGSLIKHLPLFSLCLCGATNEKCVVNSPPQKEKRGFENYVLYDTHPDNRTVYCSICYGKAGEGRGRPGKAGKGKVREGKGKARGQIISHAEPCLPMKSARK